MRYTKDFQDRIGVSFQLHVMLYDGNQAVGIDGNIDLNSYGIGGLSGHFPMTIFLIAETERNRSDRKKVHFPEKFSERVRLFRLFVYLCLIVDDYAPLAFQHRANGNSDKKNRGSGTTSS